MLNLISFSPLPRLRVQIGLPDWFYSSRDGSAQVLLRILFCRFLESMLLPVDLTHWLVYGLVIWGNYSPSWSVLNQKIVCLSVCWFEWMIEMLRIYIYIYILQFEMMMSLWPVFGIRASSSLLYFFFRTLQPNLVMKFTP